MTDLFGETPDARQDNDLLATSRFRPRRRALTGDEIALRDRIKTKAREMEELFGHVPPGRYNSLALTSLEQSIMWIIKGLTE